MELLLAHRVLEDGLHVELAPVERHRTGLQPRQIEELRDEPAEPFDLGEHRTEGLRVGILDPVDEVLEDCLQGGDRRTQLVRDVRDEVAAHAVGLGELGRHLVERPRQLAHLVARRRGDTAVVVALGHRPGGVGHLPQGRGHPAGEEPHHHQRQGTGDDPADRRPHARLEAQPEHEHRHRHRGEDDGAELDLEGVDRVQRPARAHDRSRAPPVAAVSALSSAA